jgi:hypothetical protein
MDREYYMIDCRIWSIVQIASRVRDVRYLSNACGLVSGEKKRRTVANCKSSKLHDHTA